MSVLPVDLQVLFTKASDVSENIAKNANRAQNLLAEGYEKVHKESKETNEKVAKLDQYAEDFTKVNEEGGGQQSLPEQHKKKEQETAESKEYKRAPKEDGTGRIIDIID
jgi:hypothetical protein